MISIFGFAAPLKSDLKFREYDLFQSYYCGVCKSIGKRYGNLKRFGLVNEMGMLALLLDAVSSKTSSREFVNKCCIAHPLKKRPNVLNSEYIDYAADINVIVDYFKLKDSWTDDRNLLSNTAGGLIFSRAAKKAGKNNPSVYESSKLNIAKLLKLESEKCASLDMAAEPFADMMGDVFALAPGIEDRFLVSLRCLGYHIGKWIYLIDALYDLEKDFKKKHYNPLFYRFDYKPDEDINEFKMRIKDELCFVMYDSLGRSLKAWNELKEAMPEEDVYRDTVGYMDNLINKGLLLKTEKGFSTDESV